MSDETKLRGKEIVDAADDDETADLHDKAKKYAKISLTLKALSDKGKSLRKQRKDLTPEIIEGMTRAGVECISFANKQGAIKLVTKDVNEKITADVIEEHLVAFMESNRDDKKLPVTQRAQAATGYIYENLEKTEKTSLRFKAPAKKRKAADD